MLSESKVNTMFSVALCHVLFTEGGVGGGLRRRRRQGGPDFLLKPYAMFS
jgi:hypothetical protein